MNGNLVLDNFGPISFDPGLPPVFSSYQLRGAAAIHARGPWGHILFQEVAAIHCTIRYFLFRLSEALSFSIMERNEGLQSILSLEGEMEYGVEGLERFHMLPHEFLLLDARERPTQVTIAGGKTCAVWNTYYRLPGYEPILPLLPGFSEDLDKAVEAPLYFLRVPRAARLTVVDTVGSLFVNRDLPQLAPMSFESRMQSTFITLLSQTYDPVPYQPPTLAERKIAYGAREIILSDISKHFRIDEISAALFCTPVSLQRAFRKMYGMGPFHFLRKMRMDKAREMLLKGHHVKDIVQVIGMNPDNFPKEFKSYFGYTVTALRKSLR